MNTITIRANHAANCYMATYTGNAAGEIARLFGCTTLPTPYTLRQPIGEIVKAISALNPGYNVNCAEVEPC